MDKVFYVDPVRGLAFRGFREQQPLTSADFYQGDVLSLGIFLVTSSTNAADRENYKPAGMTVQAALGVQGGDEPQAVSANVVDAPEASAVVSTLQEGATGLNDRQKIKFSDNILGGGFKLTWGGNTTSLIDYNASASVIVAALENLSTVESGDVAVTRTALREIIIEFQGTKAGADQSEFAVDVSALESLQGWVVELDLRTDELTEVMENTQSTEKSIDRMFEVELAANGRINTALVLASKIWKQVIASTTSVSLPQAYDYFPLRDTDTGDIHHLYIEDGQIRLDVQ